MNPAPNLVLVGPTGAGKSSIGRRLAGRFGLRFADADHEIVRRAGAGIPTIFECEGESGFRQRESETLAILLAGEGLLIATGGGAVLGEHNRALMSQRGFVVHLHVSVEHQLERLARDRSRPLLAVEDRERVLRDMAAQRLPLYEAVADLHFDTTLHSASHATIALARQLAARWTISTPPPSSPKDHA